MSHPPVWALRLLALTLPDDVREGVIGDLEELHAARVQAGARTPRLWFWFQALWFSLRFSTERIRDGVEAALAGRAFSLLDLKLGLRMLAKSPLLTVAGCLAIAAAICAYASYTQFFDVAIDPGVDVPDRHRIVTLTQRDIDSGRLHSQLMFDLHRWQAALETVESLGALRPYEINVIVPDGRAVPVQGVELTASALELAGLVPEMGRTLVAADEIEGADRVVVLSQELWQTLLGGDPEAIGATIRLGPEPYTVVGVAQAGFQFPIGRYFWTPMRMNPADFAPLSGPPIVTIARIASGRSRGDVEAELAQLHTLVSAEESGTHALLRPVVAPFHHRFRAGGIDGVPPMFLALVQLLFIAIMFVACVNVATLVFARNAARSTEIAIRTALGADRVRIVSQLFAEAMVLAFIAAVLGLGAASIGFEVYMDLFWLLQRTPPPPWFEPGLTPSVIGRSVVLAVLGAGIIGVLPALRATSARLGGTLQKGIGGGGVMHFGQLPTLVIVAQTAISVAVVPVMLSQVLWEASKFSLTTAVETERFASARVRMDDAILEEFRGGGGEGALGVRYTELRNALTRRLEAEPDIRTVSYTTRLPGISGGSIPRVYLDIDGIDTHANGAFTASGRIDEAYWEAIEGQISEGRALRSSEHRTDAKVAIVNRSFVDAHLGGRSAIGRLVREAGRDESAPNPWVEIVGVVENTTIGPDEQNPVILFPVGTAMPHPARLIVAVDGDPTEFGSRLRALSAEVAPGLILDELYSLEELRRSEVAYERFFLLLLAFLSAITLLLSTTGVYALMSFIVARRTREIGIRTALGANARLIVRGIFGRALGQLGAGAAVGALLCAMLAWALIPASVDPIEERRVWATLLVVAVFLVGVGLLGCILPVRRGLRVEPTEALRAD